MTPAHICQSLNIKIATVKDILSRKGFHTKSGGSKTDSCNLAVKFTVSFQSQEVKETIEKWSWWLVPTALRTSQSAAQWQRASHLPATGRKPSENTF